MFISANNIEEINFHKANLSSLENVELMFEPSYGESKIKYIDFSEAVM